MAADRRKPSPCFGDGLWSSHVFVFGAWIKGLLGRGKTWFRGGRGPWMGGAELVESFSGVGLLLGRIPIPRGFSIAARFGRSATGADLTRAG